MRRSVPLRRLAPHRSLPGSPWRLLPGGGFTAPLSVPPPGPAIPEPRGGAGRAGRQGGDGGRPAAAEPAAAFCPRGSYGQGERRLAGANSWPSAVFYGEEKPITITIVIIIIVRIIMIMIIIIIIIILIFLDPKFKIFFSYFPLPPPPRVGRV